ncbi:uncharacterized protein LOC132625212 isoform X2 [Lycium barbarum]|uniref:uncharacterized protein LOC132625212 isoform X2 n=1 Tax=Lycium barbarum TaxID=112863 RepID=UPI00293E9DD8|nr:uncharacterized protein LOC132625212 isoform X2 [Lycium barbarum]
MSVSSVREMNDSLAITASSLAITEKKPQRPGGFAGIFFQLFDWNRRFAKKKLFPKKLLSSARFKEASKKFGGDEKQPKIRLIANENSGGFPNAKNNGMTNARCESKREMKAPNLVARLMGLESMPAGPGGKSKKASASGIGSNMAEKLGAQPGGSDNEDMNFEKAEIKRELRPQKLQKTGLSERRPVSRFSAEALQLKTVLSRPRKHQPKLVSPVKSPRNVSGRNASRLIGAATRILEPGLQKNRAKCALTYPRYFSPLEDKADFAPHHSECPNSYVDSKTLKGASVPSCKNCGYLLHSKNGTPNVDEHQHPSSVSSPVSSYSEPSCQGPGINMPRLPIFGSRNQQEIEIDDVSYCTELILGKRPISRSQIEMHGTRKGSNVKKDVSSVTHVHKQKQSQTSQYRERGLMKSKPSSLQSNKVLAATESTNNTKNFVAQNRRLGASSCKFETERKPYSRRSDCLSPVRKKRLMNVSRQGESSVGRESRPCSDKTSRKDVVFPISSVDKHSTKPKLPCLRESGTINDSSEGSNVVSFTFKSAMKQKAGIHGEVTKRKSQHSSSFDATTGRSFFKGNDETACLQKSFPLKGDILGALLEQKLKELTSEEEFAEGGAAPRKSTATILQELITALNAERQFHLDSLPLRPSRKEELCGDGDVSSRNTCMNFQSTPDSATVGNSLDIDHRSPGCVLEATFSNDSYLSSSPNSSSSMVHLSSSPNNSSKDKLLAESVDSISDEPLFPEPDRDLSDCATSLFTRRSYRALITDHVNNISRVLSKIDQLKGSKLSYAKEVVLNTELIFGATCEQQALPVDDGFSLNQFFLNELEMLSSLLWMTFGQLLGCNDPKQMSQLKGFAFDCLLEYLDSKFGRYSDSGFRTWTRLPSSMTKEILIADIIEEVKEWTEFVGLIPDELIEWDMSHSLGKWTDFEIEEFECGTEVDRHILQVLVDEVVLDLYGSS